jgi:hypothetical protein
MNIKEITCKSCGEQMRQIGPFARAKDDGDSAHKWDGSFDFQCINVQCENYENIVTVDVSGNTFIEEMNEMCACAHSRSMHGNLFSLIPDGQSTPIIQKDKNCEVDDCECTQFVIV